MPVAPSEQQLAALVAEAPGRLSAAVRGDDGYAWDHDAWRVTRSASTIKVPILVTVLRLVEGGRLGLEDEVVLPPAAERVGGCGPLSLLPSVATLPLVELLRLMIALSDNDATNAILDHTRLLETGTVGALLEEVPTRHTALRRQMMDPVAAARHRENETCAADLATILGALREGRLLGPELTNAAVEMMQAQQFRAGLPASLPDGVQAGSKTGDLPGLRADMALLERGGRWVTVAVVADELGDRPTTVLPVFADIGRLAAQRLALAP